MQHRLEGFLRIAEVEKVVQEIDTEVITKEVKGGNPHPDRLTGGRNILDQQPFTGDAHKVLR